MPFPDFNFDGVIPPFSGPTPGAPSHLMTPYSATSVEVVAKLASTPQRRAILLGWLVHRHNLRALGLNAGFQWLDGSFVEDKVPYDVDVVTFFRRPLAATTAAEIQALFVGNPAEFEHDAVKAAHHVDGFYVDLDATTERVVDSARYWLGLFSHRRSDSLWKGMLKVPLDDNGADAAAQALLAAAGPAAYIPKAGAP